MNSTLDRITGPNSRGIAKIDFLPVSDQSLDNGLPVWLLEAGSQDVTKIDFQFPAGAIQAGMPLLASATANLMLEGTATKDSMQISETLDYYGAYLNTQTYHHQTTLTLLCLSKHLFTLLPLVEEIIKTPSFPPHELDIFLEKKREEFLLESQKVRTLAARHLGETLFGAHHPYGRQLYKKHFKQINLQQIRKFHSACYSEGPELICVAGKPGIELQEILNKMFGTGERSNQARTEEQIPEPASSKDRFHSIAKPGALQSAINIGRPLFNYHHPHFIPLQVLNTILGGYFGSRLMTSIREEKGLTYGIGSFIIPLKQSGIWGVNCEVACQNREIVTNAVFEEFEKLCTEPVTEQELQMVKNYMMGELLRNFDGPFSTSDIFRSLKEYDLTFSFFQDMIRYIQQVTAPELQQLARQYLVPQQFWTVVAGGE